MLVAQGDQGQGEANLSGQGAPLLCLAREALGGMDGGEFLMHGGVSWATPSSPVLVTTATGPAVLSTGCCL